MSLYVLDCEENERQTQAPATIAKYDPRLAEFDILEPNPLGKFEFQQIMSLISPLREENSLV